MKNKSIFILCAIALFAFQANKIHAQKKKRPNIVLIVSDDQGYADASYQTKKSQVSTPAIDRLAGDGVVFTNGYASGYVCSPTRAGLLTGRYQQRFGFYRAPDSRIGLPLSEFTLAQFLKQQGYTTGVFGKWHLGLTMPYHPLNRGFDEFYGFLGHGAHDYFDLGLIEDPAKQYQSIYRNKKIISDSGYLTDILAREAINFIDDKTEKEEPFFLYLPFNAVHNPLQAPEEDIKKFKTGDPKRDILHAMLYRMDIAVGNVVEALKKNKIYDETLIFFFSDNGGASSTNADNYPLKGYKHSIYEGGHRVPFIVSWPSKYKPTSSDEPIMSIDIMPTIAAAIDAELPKDIIYDGKNLLNVMDNKLTKPLHEQLYFDGADDKWAVREGDWKLLYNKKKIELYNLAEDISEKNNLNEQYPDKVADLEQKYKTWRSQMGDHIRPPKSSKAEKAARKSAKKAAAENGGKQTEVTEPKEKKAKKEKKNKKSKEEHA